MNRRSTGAGRFWRPALIGLLWASQLLAMDGRRGAAGNLPAGAAYLGQTPPGETPALFAPGSLSASRYLGRLAFSPDGLECFFTADDATYSTMSLLVTRFANDAWEAPAPAPFTSGFEKSGEPFFSRDGKKLTFTAQARGTASRMDFWTVERAGGSWGTPVRLPSPINSDANDFCFSQVQDGTIYFLSNRSGSPQVYRALQSPDKAYQVELIPAPVLSVGTYEEDPCVPPDGRFLVFSSGRAGGLGGVDLYASFADGKGGWTSPVPLGAGFNTDADEYGATLSPDGKYLFFVRHSALKGEIYWASTRAIEKLRR